MINDVNWVGCDKSVMDINSYWQWIVVSQVYLKDIKKDTIIKLKLTAMDSYIRIEVSQSTCVSE